MQERLFPSSSKNLYTSSVTLRCFGPSSLKLSEPWDELRRRDGLWRPARGKCACGRGDGARLAPLEGGCDGGCDDGRDGGCDGWRDGGCDG
jgi:hypothetical protein